MPSGSRCDKLLFRDRLGAGKHDRLGHAHRLGQVQPRCRIFHVYAVVVRSSSISGERDALGVATVFTHDSTSVAAGPSAGCADRAARRPRPGASRSTLAHHLEGRGEGAGDRRRPLLRARQIVASGSCPARSSRRSSPISRIKISRASCERPDAALGDAHIGDRLALALRRHRRSAGRRASPNTRLRFSTMTCFRHAAREDVAAQPVAVDEPAAASRIASSRFRRNCSTAAISSPLWPLVLGWLRDEQLGLQEGEPGRHHEIVGGEFQPDAARASRRIRDTARPAPATEMRARSTFWLRARCSSRSSGPSKPATSTTSDGSPVARDRRSRPTAPSIGAGFAGSVSARRRPRPLLTPSCDSVEIPREFAADLGLVTHRISPAAIRPSARSAAFERPARQAAPSFETMPRISSITPLQ